MCNFNWGFNRVLLGVKQIVVQMLNYWIFFSFELEIVINARENNQNRLNWLGFLHFPGFQPLDHDMSQVEVQSKSAKIFGLGRPSIYAAIFFLNF